MLQKYAAALAAAGLVVTVACAQTDAGITTNVKSKLAADETVSAYAVDVDSRNGVVTLSGTVETSAAKETAIRLARETEGVQDVIDQIRVGETTATGGSDADNDVGVDFDADNDIERRADDLAGRAGAIVDDAAITSAVKARFLADTAVQGLNIDVDTDDGVVTLSGTVASRAEADRAANLARNTEGVKNVLNNLRTN